MPDHISLLTISVAVFSFAGALIGTRLAMSYAIATELYDNPNLRSSHSRPTARGGGVAIVAVMVVMLVTLILLGVEPLLPLVAVLVSGIGVAVAGFIDDRRNLPAWQRLIIHSLSAAIVVAVIGPLSGLQFPSAPSSLILFAYLLTIVGIVWAINLYNFMDGIDGIACIQAISMSAIALTVLDPTAPNALPLLYICIGASSAGFLVWNWAPARIFMGDIGSGFLGLMYACLLLWSVNSEALSVSTALIIPSVFVVDSTVTLFTRMLRRDRWFAAHRSHAYQNAARQFRSHAKVSAATGFVNVVWVLPLAIVSQRYAHIAPWTAVATYVSLGLVAFGFRAGRPELDTSTASVT